MGEINSANVPCDNPEKSEKIMLFIESTKYRGRDCYSTPWYHLMSEEMVYMWCWWNNPKKKIQITKVSHLLPEELLTYLSCTEQITDHITLCGLFKFLGTILPLIISKGNFYEFVLMFLWFTFFLYNDFLFSGYVFLKLCKTEAFNFREEQQKRLSFTYLICFT